MTDAGAGLKLLYLRDIGKPPLLLLPIFLAQGMNNASKSSMQRDMPTAEQAQRMCDVKTAGATVISEANATLDGNIIKEVPRFTAMPAARYAPAWNNSPPREVVSGQRPFEDSSPF